MALYVIADTHLSGSVEKPMDIFGSRWHGWTEKIRNNWTETVKEGDTVVIAGDISWAMTLEEAKEDFLFLDSLPGRKLISRGNHDYWWNTVSKTERFLKDNNIGTVSLLHNNSYFADGKIICGCRGWYTDEKNSPKETDYEKIILREAGRLKISLGSSAVYGTGEKIVFFHFPPVLGDFVCEEFIAILQSYGVKRCYFGHIHGRYDINESFEYKGIEFRLISADYLNFKPHRII